MEDFAGKAPLWYYILAEAQQDWLTNGGKSDTPVRLGLIGSRIVVETFVGLLLHDGHSLLRQAPAWTPVIGKKKDFDMPDLIKYALHCLLQRRQGLRYHPTCLEFLQICDDLSWSDRTRQTSPIIVFRIHVRQQD